MHRDNFVMLLGSLPKTARMSQVLIIEDDKDIRELISIHLNDLVCQIKQCSNGESGLKMATEDSFDLIVLDIMLPGMDGLEVCRKLRSLEILTPILMLTAKSEEIDKVLGLETGADDYLTKPFSIREFVARVKAILRRQSLQKKPVPNSKIIRFGSKT